MLFEIPQLSFHYIHQYIIYLSPCAHWEPFLDCVKITLNIHKYSRLNNYNWHLWLSVHTSDLFTTLASEHVWTQDNLFTAVSSVEHVWRDRPLGPRLLFSANRPLQGTRLSVETGLMGWSLKTGSVIFHPLWRWSLLTDSSERDKAISSIATSVPEEWCFSPRSHSPIVQVLPWESSHNYWQPQGTF